MSQVQQRVIQYRDFTMTGGDGRKGGSEGRVRNTYMYEYVLDGRGEKICIRRFTRSIRNTQRYDIANVTLGMDIFSLSQGRR